MLGAILHDELLRDVTELVKAYKILTNKQFFRGSCFARCEKVRFDRKGIEQADFEQDVQRKHSSA